MIIDCICGKKRFRLADEVMPAEGSKVRCGSCSEVWFYHPNQGSSALTKIGEDENNEVQSSQTDLAKETSIESTTELPPSDDPDELLSTIDTDEIVKESEKENSESATNFKIFTDEEDDLPPKDEMDKNLDDYTFQRQKNLNFFQKFFKKDRLGDAAKSLDKKRKELSAEQNKKNDVARRTRLLFYLLILLSIVFSVVIVPIREDVTMAFPFLKGYLEFLVPVYDYIKGPLGL